MRNSDKALTCFIGLFAIHLVNAVNLGGPCDPADPAVAKLESVISKAKACSTDSECVLMSTPIRAALIAVNKTSVERVKKAQSMLYCSGGIGHPAFNFGVACRNNICDEGYDITATDSHNHESLAQPLTGRTDSAKRQSKLELRKHAN